MELFDEWEWGGKVYSGVNSELHYLADWMLCKWLIEDKSDFMTLPDIMVNDKTKRGNFYFFSATIFCLLPNGREYRRRYARIRYIFPCTKRNLRKVTSFNKVVLDYIPSLLSIMPKAETENIKRKEMTISRTKDWLSDPTGLLSCYAQRNLQHIGKLNS